MQNSKILIIDDDVPLAKLLEKAYELAGAQVCKAHNGKDGFQSFSSYCPDLVVLDVMLPDLEGWEICRQIRQNSKVPIIMLTALRADQEIVRGLEYGADDFVSKPFSIPVLIARTRALLRRMQLASGSLDSGSYDDGYLTVHIGQRRVLVQGEPVKLTTTEHHLLDYLVNNAGRVLTFRQILENVWGWEYQDSVDYVHVYVSHLRRKLGEDPKNPRYLLTEHGTGYRFEKQTA